MLNGLYNLDVRFVVKQFYMMICFKFPTVLISNPFSDCLLLLPCKVLQVKLTQIELVTFSSDFSNTKCKSQYDDISKLDEVFAVMWYNSFIGWRTKAQSFYVPCHKAIDA